MTLKTRALALAGIFALAGTAADAGSARPVVVELYTSQGCNSCPPADAFLGKLTQRGDVLALTLPVTYWDMLGWKDSLANEANTRRQKEYAAAMGHGGVYTPQIVVDGALDVVGSRTASVEAAIEARREAIEAAYAMAEAHNAVGTVTASRVASGYEPAAAPSPSPSPSPWPHHADPLVPVSLSENGQELHINIGGVDGAQNATVWLLHLRSAVTVAIKAGENEGRSVTYRNVVGDIRAVGIWKGGPLSLSLPRSAMAGLPHDAVAVLVQHGGYGHVIGASYIAHPDFYPSH
jgi:hypothetical protein